MTRRALADAWWLVKVSGAVALTPVFWVMILGAIATIAYTGRVVRLGQR